MKRQFSILLHLFILLALWACGHGIAFHDDDATASPATRGQRDELSYRRLLTAVELPAPGGPDRLLPAYNLLWTRPWMLLVPRRVECFDGISLNALAFAGALLVKDDDQLDALRRRGPLFALVYVTSAQAFR